MSQRFHRLFVVGSGLIVLVVLMWSTTIPVSGQNRAYKAPRTPDGQPDLQGFWTNTTYTPLQRPKDVTKEFYTREEALEILKRAAIVEGEDWTATRAAWR
jgi:hypothetical protein